MEAKKMHRAARKRWTWDDYVRLPEDGKRYEIIEGDLVVMSGPSFRHQLALGRLYSLFNAWSARGVGGAVVVAPIDVSPRSPTGMFVAFPTS